MTKLRLLLTVAGSALLLPATLAAQPAADTIVVGLSADVTTFDPANISSRDNANIARHIFGTLYEVTGEGRAVADVGHRLLGAHDHLVHYCSSVPVVGPSSPRSCRTSCAAASARLLAGTPA